jgi:vancomycin resistance protein VanJ
MAGRSRSLALLHPMSRSALAPAAMTLLVVALLLAHAAVPHVFAIGTLWESALPWVVLVVPVVAYGAFRRRNLASAAAAVLLLVAWAAICLPLFTRHHAQSTGDLRLVTHDVNWSNPDPAGTAQVVAAATPDVVTLQEVRPDAAPAYTAALPRLPHHAQFDRVGVWSRWPIRATTTLDLGEDWRDIHRVVVDAPGGELVVYAVHLPWPSPFEARQSRDVLLERLGQEVAADPGRRLVVAGDLNTGETDSSLAPLTRHLRDATRDVANGPTFTWPAWAPAISTDHVLCRGLRPTAVQVLPLTGSQHRPLLAQLR